MTPVWPVPTHPRWLRGVLDLYEQVRLARLDQTTEPPPQKQRVNRGSATTTTGSFSGFSAHFTEADAEQMGHAFFTVFR